MLNTRKLMKLIVPASACLGLPPKLRKGLGILRQPAMIGTKQVSIDRAFVERPTTLAAGQVIRFCPITIGELVLELERLNLGSNVMLLTPSPLFDSTPYNNLVQSLTQSGANLHANHLHCYGSAFVYLLQGIFNFINTRSPNAEQLTLFINGLNDLTVPFLICNRSKEFESDLNLIDRWRSQLSKGEDAYRINGVKWEFCDFMTIGRTTADLIRDGALVWIDSQQGDEFAKRILGRLRSWGLREEFMIFNRLTHISRRFPDEFAMVSLAPAKPRIQKLAEFVMKYT